MEHKHLVIELLMFRRGRENGVTAREIAATLRLTEREVRKSVSEARMDGVQLCGHPSSGYFIAATAEELEATCAFLRSRAMHSLVLEAKLRNVALPELLGQLRLKT